MFIFKTNKFFRVIKHFILALPLMAILGVSLYTIVNTNAKDSYYGDTINEVVTENVTEENFNISQYYNLKINIGVTGFTRSVFSISDITSFNSSYTPIVNWVNNNKDNIEFLVIASDSYKFVLFDSTESATVNLTYNSIDIDFYLLTGTYNSTLAPYMILFTYNEYSYLSNAFAYAMNEFNNIGFGKIDFVGLVNGIFNNGASNVYLDFVNSYINYYLMIECVYFAPWVLHMFIHMAYELGDYFTSIIKRKKGEDD